MKTWYYIYIFIFFSLTSRSHEFSLSYLGKPIKGLYFQGGGIYYYWQAGAAQFLREQYSKFSAPLPTMVGASAGSLTSSLLATGVDFAEATAYVIRQAERERLYERKLGLAGIWGRLVKEWLIEMIPEELDAERQLAGLHIAVTPLRSMKPVLLTDFQNKSDLIQACMGSIHIPFFLDGRSHAICRGERVVDGSFWSFMTRSDNILLPVDPLTGIPMQMSDVFVLDYLKDEKFCQRNLQSSIVSRVSPDGLVAMMESGYSYMNSEFYSGRLCLSAD